MKAFFSFSPQNVHLIVLPFCSFLREVCVWPCKGPWLYSKARQHVFIPFQVSLSLALPNFPVCAFPFYSTSTFYEYTNVFHIHFFKKNLKPVSQACCLCNSPMPCVSHYYCFYFLIFNLFLIIKFVFISVRLYIEIGLEKDISHQ